MDRKELLDNVSRRLRMERAAVHVSQREVSEAVGMTPTQLSQYENGARMLSIKAASALADYYGISLDELVGR